MSAILDDLCTELRRLIDRRRLIPFLGAAASAAGRPPNADWERDGYAPSGSELTHFLADAHAYPGREDEPGLMRVAQYVDLKLGEQALYDELRAICAASQHPTSVHRLLAEEAAHARRQGRANPWPLIVTTNYDDLLERAFGDVGEPVDVVAYFAARNRPGSFLHRRSDGTQTTIRRPSTYREFAPEERTTIVKLHGGFDRDDERFDTFVITENDYIAYMAHDVARRLPACLLRDMLSRHFAFLGYSLADWNLRAFLYRVWEDRRHSAISWAILHDPQPIERAFWSRRDVQLVDAKLELWATAMEATRT